MGKRRKSQNNRTCINRRWQGHPIRHRRGHQQDIVDSSPSGSGTVNSHGARKRQHDFSMEPIAKRQRLDPRIVTGDNHTKEQIAINVGSCIRYLYDTAKASNEEQFVNECQMRFKDVFNLSQTVSRRQFDDILQMSRRAEFEKNKNLVAGIIEDLPCTRDVCPSDLTNNQSGLCMALSFGHLMTDEQFLRLLRFLVDVRHYQPSLLCQILQDTNFFNNAGVLSNIVHLFRKYKEDCGQLLRFCDDITSVLSTLAKSRKSNKEMVLSCLYLLNENITRLTTVDRERIKITQRLEKINSTISENEQNTQDTEELQAIASYPILPSTDMVKENRGPIIPPRRRLTAFGSETEYLSYYFNTFLEDFIGPLRNGMNRYVQYVNDRNEKHQFRDDDIRLYKRVKITKEKYLLESGKVFEIQFDVSSFKKLRWDTCDFLKYGNLVCLTYNDCQEIVYGLVAERNVPDLRSGKTLIKIVSDDQIMSTITGSETQLVMIESKAFFTAYHHTLVELQNMAERMIDDRTECIPLAETIVFQQEEILPPLYIKSKSESKRMNFTCMLRYGESTAKQSDFLKLIDMPNRKRKAYSTSNVCSDSAIYMPVSPTYIPIMSENAALSPTYRPSSPSYTITVDYNSSSSSSSHAYTSSPPLSPNHIHPTPCVPSGITSSLEGKEVDTFNSLGSQGESSNNRNRTFTEFPVLSFNLWPSSEMIGLDSSQYAAFRHAITSSLAIIQGPPGTGKTFLGLRIAEFMLHNHDRIHSEGRKPILLLSYTNHALDQFMEEIMQKRSIRHLFSGGKTPFLRIGGRCENDVVKRASLLEHKKRLSMFYERDIKRRLYRLSRAIDGSLEVVKRIQCNIMDEECLLLKGIIPHHFRHFFLPCSNKRETLLLQFLQISSERFSKDNYSTYQGHILRDESFYSNHEIVDKELYHEMISHRIVVEEDKIEYDDSPQETYQFAYFCPEVKISKSKIEEKVRRELSLSKPLSDFEERKLRNPWALSIEDRWRLYKLWAVRAELRLKTQNEENIKSFLRQNKELKDIQEDNTIKVMEDCEFIAMTTTGAAKHMDILRKVAPRIIIVEEAAQVNEQHILGCLHKDVQHLIFIGDHQQLKPTVNNFNLARHHATDISMMERLALNGVPFKRLNEQHRMIPIISDLLRSTIYEDLLDHGSVLEYQQIRGMTANVVLFDHSEEESQRNEYSTSYRNDFEAEMIAHLYRYLRLQGYKSSEITILSAYNEQVRCIRNVINPIDRELGEREKYCETYKQGTQSKKDEKNSLQGKHSAPEKCEKPCRRSAPLKREGVRVTAVDNFQGEENKIILLSLVRCNKIGRIGHLRDEKRICVSLSRAKLGLFVLGNFSMLQEQSKCWAKILEKANQANVIKDHFPLICQNHTETVINIKRPEDFSEFFPEGGCTLQCETQLQCGHMCPKTCHSDTVMHDLPCLKECTKTCNNGHSCKKKCSEPCGLCNEVVERTIPICGHNVQMRCFENPRKFACQERCERIISCPSNHKCQRKCGMECNNANDCMELVKVKDDCGHEYQLACSEQSGGSCTVPCGENLPCGHKCPGTCGSCSRGRLHEPCSQKCTRVLICGHTCNAHHPCTTNCPPCEQKCTFGCSHRPKFGCKLLCGINCIPCKEKCEWRCSDKCKNKFRCTKYCYEMCDRKRCNQPCNKKIPNCKHPCVGLCGEPCPSLCWICNKKELVEIFFGNEDEPGARFLQLIDCGHVFEVTGLDKYIDGLVSEEKSRDSNEIIFIRCPKCTTPIKRSFRYANIIKGIREDIEMVKQSVREMDARQLNILTECEHLFFNVVQCSINDQLTKMFETFLNTGKMKKLDVTYIHTLKQLIGQLNEHVVKIYLDIENKNRCALPVRNSVMQQVLKLAKWISKKRLVFSQFELEQFSMELKRLKTLIMFYIIQQDADRNTESSVEDKKKIAIAIQALVNPGINSTGELNKSMNLLSELREHIPRYGLGISHSEKIDIIRAIGLKKGHWFKCRNGHVYCIGECGGAMEKAKCPECGDNIGGERHTLTGGNSVASEMDGAEYAAWSEQANNMRNFDLENLF